MNLLSFGEIVWDMYGDRASLGGAPLNLAVHTAMNGKNAFLVSAVGDDFMGHTAIECAKRYGVNTRYISILNNTETAKCTVTDGDDGFPCYSLTKKAAFDSITFPHIGKYMDIICFGTLSLRYKNNRTVIERMLDGVPHGNVFCDINLREPFYSKETVEYCFSKATVIKVSDEEFPEVCRLTLGCECDTKTAASRLCDIYKNIVLFIITLGSDGALCYDRQSGRWYKCGAEKIQVVSTVGAGDSFSAAFLTRYLGGCGIPDCLEYASKISAMVCSCDAAFSEDMLNRIRALE